MTATPAFAALVARFRAKDVLPTPGRAAKITRSPPRNPWIRSSQLMEPGPNTRNKSTNDQVGEISRGLKILAKEMNMPVIALSQLSRAVGGTAPLPPPDPRRREWHRKAAAPTPPTAPLNRERGHRYANRRHG